MKILIVLLLASLVKTEENRNEPCIAQNVTYSLCVVNDANITVVSEPITAELLSEKCHGHFAEDVLGMPICEEHEHTKEEEGPSTAQRYGYGFLAVFIITILSLGGCLAFPLLHKVAFQYILVTFTALAVGSLLGDAMFHLIPFTLGLHSHESEEHGGHEHEEEHGRHGDEEEHSSFSIPVYQWKMLTAVIILYGFYLLEVFLHWFGHSRQNKNSVHSHGHSHAIHIGDANRIDQTNNNSSIHVDDNSTHRHHHNYNEIDPTLTSVVGNCPDQSYMLQTSVSEVKVNTNDSAADTGATSWMIIIGDGIHNFADGLAIGAAFSQDLILGLTTTIAIGCHELPHELGDYAVLIRCGFSHRRALLWNFLSALTAFVGFFIGAAVSTNESARQWIFAVTIGMFLYIALANLLPILLPEGQMELKRFICVNIGFLVGITIMFLLAMFEDKLIAIGQ